MEGLTSSEIAGFVVGALLLGATIAAPKVDGFIASSQRRSLGMCKRCGDLRIVACSQCKGTGSARNGGILNFGMLDDLYESLGAEAKTDNLVPCTKCRSKELEGIDSTILMRALRLLEQSGNAVIFKVNDSEGVRFM